MTANIIDARLSFAIAQSKNLHLEYLEKYKDVPLCKTITDFLRYHHAQVLTDLTDVQKGELMHRMGNMLARVANTSRELLSVYAVENESQLSGAQRVTYDARMKAVVESEDHYP